MVNIILCVFFSRNIPSFYVQNIQYEQCLLLTLLNISTLCLWLPSHFCRVPGYITRHNKPLNLHRDVLTYYIVFRIFYIPYVVNDWSQPATSPSPFKVDQGLLNLKVSTILSEPPGQELPELGQCNDLIEVEPQSILKFSPVRIITTGNSSLAHHLTRIPWNSNNIKFSPPLHCKQLIFFQLNEVQSWDLNIHGFLEAVAHQTSHCQHSNTPEMAWRTDAVRGTASFQQRRLGSETLRHRRLGAEAIWHRTFWRRHVLAPTF